MRILWAGFLIGGLLLAAFGTYERRVETTTADDTVVTASEDGTPWPPPDPTPPPTKLR
jgi:hypothetical protein